MAGAARLGAALLNTSTDPLTQIPDHTGGLASLAEPEASSRLSLHYTGTEQPQRDAAADAADGQPPDAVASQPISARLTRSTRARTSQVASSDARGGSALPPRGSRLSTAPSSTASHRGAGGADSSTLDAPVAATASSAPAPTSRSGLQPTLTDYGRRLLCGWPHSDTDRSSSSHDSAASARIEARYILHRNVHLLWDGSSVSVTTKMSCVKTLA